MPFHSEGRHSIGHEISKNGIKMDRPKIDMIENLPPPLLVKGVRRFLGHVDSTGGTSNISPKVPTLCVNY